TYFTPTQVGGNLSPSQVAVHSGQAATANILVAEQITRLTPMSAAISLNGVEIYEGLSYLTGFMGGQSVDVRLWITGLYPVSPNQIRVIGPGATVRPGSFQMVYDQPVNGQNAVVFTWD